MFRREIHLSLKSLAALCRIQTKRHPKNLSKYLPKTQKMALVTIPGLQHLHRHHSISECPGQIQVIFGPMFSGKTTELLRRIKRYQVANHKCLLIKYAKDIRYDEEGVATHDRQILRATPCTVLEDLKNKAINHSVIGIDEGQFFPDIVEFSEEMASEGKTIIIAALDGTFQRKAFGNILHLVPLAESVVKLSAVCMNCFKDASFTKRLGYDKRVEVIGGADKYMSVCRECYNLAEVQELLSKHSKFQTH